MRVGVFVCFMSPLRLRVSVEQMNQYPVFVDLFRMEDGSQLLFSSSQMWPGFKSWCCCVLCITLEKSLPFSVP